MTSPALRGGEYPLDLQPVDLRRALEPLLAGFYEGTLSGPASRSRWSWMNTCPCAGRSRSGHPHPHQPHRQCPKARPRRPDHPAVRQRGQLVTAFSNDAPGLSPRTCPGSLSASTPRIRCAPGRTPALVWPSSRPWPQRMGHTPLPSWMMGPSPWGCGGSRFFQAVAKPPPITDKLDKISIYIFVFLTFVYFAIIGTTSPSLLSLLDGTLHSITAEKSSKPGCARHASCFAGFYF